MIRYLSGLERFWQEHQPKQLRLWQGVQAVFHHISMALAALLGLFLTLNILLLVWSLWFTLPFAKVGNVDISLMTHQAARDKLSNYYNNAGLSIGINDQNYLVGLKDIGVSVDARGSLISEVSLDSPSTWPLFKSLGYTMTQPLPNMIIDESKLASSLVGIIPSSQTAAQPATIVDDRGSFVAVSGRIGQTMDPQIAAAVIVDHFKANAGLAVQINPELTPSSFSFAAAQAEIDNSQRIGLSSIELVHKKKSWTLEKDLIRNNLVVNTHEDGTQAIEPSANFLSNWLKNNVAPKLYKKPIAKRFSAGNLTNKGQDGAGLNMSRAINQIIAAAKTNDTKVNLSLKTIRAPVVRDGVYTKSQAGLDQLIADYVDGHWAGHRVIVEQLTGDDLYSSYQQDTPIIPASTYKAFLAYVAFKQIEAGEITLQTQTARGTVDECIFIMIHYSTNECAFAIMDLIGWDEVQDTLEENGFKNTKLNNHGLIDDKSTTATDHLRLFKGLYNANLLNKKHTKHLLDLFKGQSHRNGIPAGSPGSTVADKVGFYAGYTHDIAIVYGQKHDYILIVMTEGGTFYSIQELALKVHQFFNR